VGLKHQLIDITRLKNASDRGTLNI